MNLEKVARKKLNCIDQGARRMSTSQIYVKTPKGIMEMNNRSFNLPPDTWKLLALLNGKRRRSELAEFLQTSDCESLLAALEAGQFIVPLDTGTEPAKRERFEPPKDEEQRFEMAKNFMRNSALAFLGSLGSGFISQVDKCQSLEDLRQQFQPWREAIMLSTDGRKQAAELSMRLAALLS
jgi:hypothetical protein